MSERHRTLNIVIAALGGEGGGVLADWLSETARRAGWQTQTTSVPGVAQRTGATIYYIEMFPSAEQPAVMSLFPTPADVDLVIASEIVEAARMVQRGLVTPERTQLIASDHRVYGIAEKIELTNGIVDAAALAEICRTHARSFIHFDLMALARKHNTVISATLFGAVAGADLLPFPEQTFEQVIAASGIQVANNLAAFRASRDQAALIAAGTVVEPQSGSTGSARLPEATTPAGAEMLTRISRFPKSVQANVWHGVERLVDYQNIRYAENYLDRMEEFAGLLAAEDVDREILRELARYLALWMSFEDIARVAQLKTRPQRMASIRDEVLAATDQLVYVTEYFSPRVEEFCAYLPPGMARYILASKTLCKGLSLFTGGRRIRSNTISAYLLLRGVAALRHLRQKTYGYAHERRQIDAWLDAVAHCLSAPQPDREAALELVACGRLIKGYGATRERGQQQMRTILQAVSEAGADAPTIKTLREAAFADDQGVAFQRALGAH